MPDRCCVPFCNGNYDSGPKVSCFSFPIDPDLKKKWLLAIKRDKFTPSKSSKVCELHFQAEDIERTTNCYIEATGELLTAPLKKPRLKKDAVPSILPKSCPKYLSKPSCTHRRSPETKKIKLENDHLQKVIAESLITMNVYNSERIFENLDEAYLKISKMSLNDWVISRSPNFINFVYLQESPYPSVICLVYLDKDLKLSLKYKNKSISSIKSRNNEDLKFSLHITNINQLEDTLQDVLHFTNKKDEDLEVESACELIKDILHSLVVKLPAKEKVIDFLNEQIELLKISTKYALRYTWKTIIFSSLLFAISPHAYKFLRASDHLTLPCTNTLKNICSKFKTDPRMEQFDENFLQYMRSKFKHLKENDKLVSLMIDEIHIKPYIDYKGGNIVGAAYNISDSATTAHVFMVNSLRSSYKDVAHILPVKTICASDLHYFIKKVIEGLENIGFEVICVVSDNNNINRKAMTFFATPPNLAVEYQHPVDPLRPLFFVIDTVHILKNFRNNWINEASQCMRFPDFNDGTIKIASFEALKDMHTKECGQLLKYGYKLSLKALYPNSLERQNVKLVLQIINKNTIVALRELGPKLNLSYYDSTADYLEIIDRWWDIVNVKTLSKGQRLRNPFQEPITKNSNHILEFLNKFLLWLDNWWKNGSIKTGRLSKETHLAVAHTTEALLKVTSYCLHVKNFNFILLGKIQTDLLEERFGKYRYQAGSQYHVSVRQIYESEKKLRMMTVIPLCLKSNKFGDIQISKDLPDFFENDNISYCEISTELRHFCQIDEDDVSKIPENIWPSLIYVSGYAAYSLIKKLKCNYCKFFLTECDTTVNQAELITANDRGGLCYPSQDVVTCTSYVYLLMKQLLQNEELFLRQRNQRFVLMKLSLEAIDGFDLNLFLGHNCSDHVKDFLISNIVKSISNILLKNYIKEQNDILKPKTMPQLKRVKPGNKL